MRHRGFSGGGLRGEGRTPESRRGARPGLNGSEAPVRPAALHPLGPRRAEPVILPPTPAVPFCGWRTPCPVCVAPSLQASVGHPHQDVQRAPPSPRVGNAALDAPSPPPAPPARSPSAPAERPGLGHVVARTVPDTNELPARVFGRRGGGRTPSPRALMNPSWLLRH